MIKTPYLVIALFVAFGLIVMQERCRGNDYAKAKATADSLRVVAGELQKERKRIAEAEKVHDSLNIQIEKLAKNLKDTRKENQKLDVRIHELSQTITPQIIAVTSPEVLDLMELKDQKIDKQAEIIAQQDTLIESLRLDVRTLSSVLYQKDTLLSKASNLNIKLQDELDDANKHRKGGFNFLHAGLVALGTALVIKVSQ